LGWKDQLNSKPTTAFPHRDAFALISLSTLPKKVQTPIDVYGMLKSLRDFFANHDASGMYLGYPDRYETNFGMEYWADNFARLQSIKTKYDPQNIFSHPQSIPLPE